MAKVDKLDAARDACLALVELCGAFLLLVRDLYRWSDSAQELLAKRDEMKRREYARAEPFRSLLVKLDNAQSLASQSFEKVRLSLLAVAANRCAHQQIIEQADTILKVAGFEFDIKGRIAELDPGRTLDGMMGAMLWPVLGRDAWPEIDVEVARQRIAVEHAKALAVDREVAAFVTEDDHSQLVTLDQLANMIQRGKSTLERWRAKDQNFPPPDIPRGAGRKAHLWKWQSVRSYLIDKTGRSGLPERFPSLNPR